MRKVWGVILCGCSLWLGPVHANECFKLWVMIRNQTVNDCVLLRATQHGDLRASTLIPESIAPGETSLPFEMHQTAFSGPNVVLTYQCGEDKEITFKSHQDWCHASTPLGAGDITGTILDSINMYATFEEEKGHGGSVFKSHHGTISWTLFSE